MEKTKLGISAELLGVIVFAAALFGGYFPLLLAAGYILLREENEWLRKSAVQAVTTSILFSFLIYTVGLIPDALDWFGSLTNIFGTSFYFSVVNGIINAVTSALSIIREVLFLLMILKAFKQESIQVPVVDKIIEKYM